jgi:MFS family permease
MDDKSIYPAYRWLILLIGCLVIISYAIDMIVFAPIFGEVVKDLKIHMGAAIHLAMAFAIASAIAMMFGGMIIDRYGLTAAYVLCLLCASVPALLMPWIGHSYGVVFASRLVQGMVAISVAAIGPILALWFPRKEQGLAGGLLMCSLSVGPAIGVVASPAVFQAVGSWQVTVAVLSLPGWLALILALLGTRRKPSEAVVKGIMDAMKAAGGEGVTYKTIFSLPMTWVGTFIVFFNSWGIYGLYNLIPPYLATPQPMGVGLDLVLAGKLSLALIVVGIPAFILGGLFFDKVAKGNHRPAIFIGFIMTGLFTYLLLLPAVYQDMGLLVVCLMAAGWGMSFMAASLSAFIAMNYPPNFVGGMMGWWFGFGTFGGALGTYLAGLATVRLGNFFWALLPISLAACAGLILAFFLKPAKRA